MEQIRRILRPTDVPDTGSFLFLRVILILLLFFAVSLRVCATSTPNCYVLS